MTRQYNLYADRYLIAVYDNQDNLISVGTSAKELNMSTNYLSKLVNGHRSQSKVIVIDCLEQHCDVFSEEDKLFLDEHASNTCYIKDICSKFNISRRTYYRHRQYYDTQFKIDQAFNS